MPEHGGFALGADRDLTPGWVGSIPAPSSSEPTYAQRNIDALTGWAVHAKRNIGEEGEMSDKTGIEWADATWNPVVGCSKVSPGCANCYAEVIAEKHRGSAGFPNGFDPVTIKPDRVLNKPAHWREPRFIFVNSMSDLFHEEIPDDNLRMIWDVMVEIGHHAYLVLTKRPEEMLRRLDKLDLTVAPNIWLGVSAENQRWFDHRVPLLRETGAETLFVSCEPLLGPIRIEEHAFALDWVIVGGESGSNRRPLDKEWARSIRDECAIWSVPFFFKQGSHYRPGRDRDLDGRTWDERPRHPHAKELDYFADAETCHISTTGE